MKYSCLICMGSGSLVNARTDLQLTIISCTHTDCPTFWVSIIGTFFNHWWILQVPKTRALRGLWGNTTPQNFEILMVWNPISIVQRGQFLSKMSLKLIICQFFWISVSVNNIYYTLLGVLVSSIVRIHLKNVKIRIFLSQ